MNRSFRDRLIEIENRRLIAARKAAGTMTFLDRGLEAHYAQRSRERAAAAPGRARRGRAPRLATNTRTRGSRRTGATRAGPSGDDPHEPGGDDPPGHSRQLLPAVENYLERLGSWGAERPWLIEQITHLGYEPERVGAAIALLVSERRATARFRDGSDVIWGRA